MSTSEPNRTRCTATPRAALGVLPAVLAGALLASGCGAVAGGGAPDAAPSRVQETAGAAGATPPSTAPGSPTATSSPSSEPSSPTSSEPEPPYRPSDGTPRDARLTIPELGITGLEVRAYRGRTDDATGHRIQNTGIAASPYGPRGGTGPGGIGNYQVTGHRNSAGGIFFSLPSLTRGDRVRVRAGGVEYVYEVRRTRITSFRSPQSLREQRAAVPGRPGVEPTRATITLSTCRTQEDHAEGNYWSDEFGNPEHRIDKIGVLVRSRPV